jgi:hypothetical protein
MASAVDHRNGFTAMNLSNKVFRACGILCGFISDAFGSSECIVSTVIECFPL